MQVFKEEGEACVNRVGNDDHLAREVFAHFNVRLDSIVMNWFRSNELPLFEIDGHVIYVVDERYRMHNTYDIKVFNRGKVPGIVYPGGNHPGWIIPAGEGRAIRVQTSSATNKMKDGL
mgnify:CR=1 FL=1